ncbi:YezD family protein [Geomicrobium sp. JCM 19055]|nr:YezD family protein [Geomicrobium sp. JCM 19055]
MKIDRSITEEIIAQLEKLQYGSLHITVHNGVVTQIDRTERNRLNKK